MWRLWIRFRRLLGVAESIRKSATMFHHMDCEQAVLTFKRTYAVRLTGNIVCYWQAQKLPSYLIFPYLVCIVWRYMAFIYNQNETGKENKTKNCDNIFRTNFTLAREMFIFHAWKWITCMEWKCVVRPSNVLENSHEQKVNRTECGNRFRAFIHHIKVMCDEASGILSMAMICNNSIWLKLFWFGTFSKIRIKWRCKKIKNVCSVFRRRE